MLSAHPVPAFGLAVVAPIVVVAMGLVLLWHWHLTGRIGRQNAQTIHLVAATVAAMGLGAFRPMTCTTPET